MNRLLKLERHVHKGRTVAKAASVSSARAVSYASSYGSHGHALQGSTTGIRRRGTAFNVRPKHTFRDARVTAMRNFLTSNASGTPLSCISTMNEALRRLFDNTSLPVGSEVHTTMEALRGAGLATERRVIEFLDSSNRETTGVRRPDHLPVKIAEAMMDLAQHEVGWNVFGLSLMDGYHSVLISLDNNDPGPIGGEKPPKVYWSDQWPSKGGWLEYSVDGLDAEVTRLVQTWWDGQPANAKHRTRISIWRVLGTGP